MRERKFDWMLDFVAPVTGAIIALYVVMGMAKLLGCP